LDDGTAYKGLHAMVESYQLALTGSRVEQESQNSTEYRQAVRSEKDTQLWVSWFPAVNVPRIF